jgi:hypothetical protein
MLLKPPNGDSQSASAHTPHANARSTNGDGQTPHLALRPRDSRG